ncbi:DDB1- and CUL4-associated factor 1-like [Diaphorina citri]|uniref:DDB1- and CUL4-associated factor 1-like n=1 Tax=Diaphorina citri TaxID=121845 RepID=A0A1S3D2Y2_DIACI|nr:DDB1- and CUL4-associated factor 1-like [Diaphorina citri]
MLQREANLPPLPAKPSANVFLSPFSYSSHYKIVSNTEVWDLRTFHLLRTVSQLDQCAVKFSSNESAIYAFALEPDAEEDPAFESSFKTLDAYDYSSIATVEVKKNIYDLSLNRYDTILGVVENTGVYDGVDESTVRLYDVGRRRDDDDDVQEDEDDEEEIENTDDSSRSNSDEDDDPNGKNHVKQRCGWLIFGRVTEWNFTRYCVK